MTRLQRLLSAAAITALGLVPAAAAAQVFTPTYMAPRPSNDLGIYMSSGPGDFTAEGILRRHFGTYDLGFRAGLSDLDSGAALDIGGELRAPIPTQTAPVSLAFIAGAQGIIGDVSAVGLQGGLSVGYTFVGPPVNITPYVAPRVALMDGFGPDNDMEAHLLADIGVDVDIQPRLSLRFGIGLTDENDSWGIGLAWR